VLGVLLGWVECGRRTPDEEWERWKEVTLFEHMICTSRESFAQIESLIQANSVNTASVVLTAFPGEGGK